MNIEEKIKELEKALGDTVAKMMEAQEVAGKLKKQIKEYKKLLEKAKTLA